MKIALVERYESQEPRTPIALMDLAAYARQAGHEVTVAYYENLTDLDAYEAIGISALVYNPRLLEALTSLRERYRGRIVLGGKITVALTGEQTDHLKSLGVEVFTGAGERFFDPADGGDLADYPAWSLDDFVALDQAGFVTEMMTSRGCPYRCRFCQNTELRVRWFPVERTVANAQLILEQRRRSRVFFVDDIFCFRAEHMWAVLQAADQAGLELRRRTHFFIHVKQVDAERLEAIDAYRPGEMQIGLESGDDEQLRRMGKTFTAAEAADRLALLHGHGHCVAGLFLIGFPGETRESLQNTVDFVARNRHRMSGLWVSYYVPIPLTLGWNLVQERLGRRIDGNWNTEIAYVDPNLTEEDLRQARRAIMGS